VQYLWLSRGQEKDDKEKTCRKESRKKEIKVLTATPTNQYRRSACGGIIANAAAHRSKEHTLLIFLPAHQNQNRKGNRQGRSPQL